MNVKNQNYYTAMSKVVLRHVLSKAFPFNFCLSKVTDQNIFPHMYVINFETIYAGCNRPTEDLSLSVKSVYNFYHPVKKLPLCQE